MSLYKSLIFIFWINIHQLRWYQSLCTVFCLSSKMIWSSDSISVWLHAMKKSHCLHQLKVRKIQNNFTVFLFPPKNEQKPFPDSALEARAGLEKDFHLFSGGNEIKVKFFWEFLTFNSKTFHPMFLTHFLKLDRNEYQHFWFSHFWGHLSSSLRSMSNVKIFQIFVIKSLNTNTIYGTYLQM